MVERRWSSGRFLGVLALLWAVQCIAFTPPMREVGLAAQVAWILVFQVAKIWPVAWRLNDTGRDPSDAPFLALVPLVNVAGFFSRMLEATPSDKLRAKRRAQWEGRIGAVAAAREGAKLVGRTLPLGLPLVVVFAVISALGGHFMLGRLDWAQQADPGTLETTLQALWGAAAFLGLYSLVQFGKRKTASRASWAPSLFFAPVVLVAGAFTLHRNGMAQELGPLVLSFLLMAWNLVWISIGGAAMAVGHVLLGESARRGESIGAGEVLGAIGKRTLDVAGPHGARTHAVTIGMQVLLPGIFYALQLAFVEIIAVLHPEEAALARSGRLTWGMRSRLFKVFFLWFVASMGVSAGIAYALETPEAFASSFFDPRAISTTTLFLQELAWAFLGWVLQMAMLCLYHDRLAQEAARQASASAPAVPVGNV